MCNNHTQSQFNDTAASTLAKDGLRAACGFISDNGNGSVAHMASDDERKKHLIDSLFQMEARFAYKYFTANRQQFKTVFAGQGVNAIERILTALMRMDKEGYTLDKKQMRDLAYNAALDNEQMGNFLYFVPAKIPYRERKGIKQ